MQYLHHKFQYYKQKDFHARENFFTKNLIRSLLTNNDLRKFNHHLSLKALTLKIND